MAYLEGLPRQKIHCSVMGAEALEAAVFNWAQKRGVDLESLGIDMHADERAEGRIVCKCFSLSEPYIRRKIRELNLHTIAEITNAIKAGGACMSCHHVPGGLQDLLDETWGAGDNKLKVLPQLPVLGAAPAAAAPAKEDGHPLSPYQFDKKIEKAIDEYVRPMLQQRRRKRGDRRYQGHARVLPADGRLSRLRRRRANPADAGRANPEGNGRRTHSRHRYLVMQSLSLWERVRVRAVTATSLVAKNSPVCGKCPLAHIPTVAYN